MRQVKRIKVSLQLMKMSSKNESIFELLETDSTVNLTETAQNATKSTTIAAIENFYGAPPTLLVTGIVFHIFGILMQVFTVIYERFEMDPMKRSLTNQMISTHMIWAAFLSIFTILRSIFCLFSVSLPFLFLAAIEYLMTTYTIGVTLIYLEVGFFEYWSKMVLGRIPEYDHDFLATWLQIVTFVASLFLAALQTFGTFSVQEFEDQPLM